MQTPTTDAQPSRPSQSEVARRMGVNRHHVWRWLNGHHFPRRAQLHELAAAMEMPVDKLAEQIAVAYACRHDPKK